MRALAQLPRRWRSARVLLALALGVGALAGCEDLRHFSGTWAGDVSGDPHHQVGFAPGAQLRATIGAATRAELDLALELPGSAGALRFEPIRHAGDDVLGDARLAGEPLRTYFGFVTPAAEAPLLAVVSLFAEDRVEVRLIRGANEIYGVFYLTRAP
jgi:hypothetical protein